MGITPAPRERALKKHTLEAEGEVSGTRGNGEESKTLSFEYSAVKVTRVHSFIQIFTKRLLSAKVPC